MLHGGTPKRRLDDRNQVPIRANIADHRMNLTNTLDARPAHAVNAAFDLK